MVRVAHVLALGPVLALLTACPPEETACTEEARSSVTLQVLDAMGSPAVDATATFAVDGGAEQPCDAVGDGSFACGYEISGAFRIHATAPGHLTATLDTEVTADECHVLTVTESVQLQPDDLDCTMEEVGSVALTVLDGGDPVEADDARWRPRGDDVAFEACDRTGVGTYTCGYEVAGELEVLATLDGESLATRVTVEDGECHVSTEAASLDFTPGACTDEVAYAVTVTTYDVDVAMNADTVSWGLANADMAPQPCESWGSGQYACGAEVSGLVEVYATLGDETLVAMTDVLRGECHVLGESIAFVFGVE